MINNINTLFIDSDYVKKNSPIMNDVESKLLTSHIMEAQNIDLQECLGEDLYKHYVDTLSGYTTGQTVSTLLGADYYNLYVNYMKPFILYQTIYYSFYDLYAKITAKGIVNQTSDNSITSSIELLERMRKDYKIKSDHYRRTLLEYLNDNSTTFTLFESTCSNTNANDTDYTMGLYLGPY